MNLSRNLFFALSLAVAFAAPLAKADPRPSDGPGNHRPDGPNDPRPPRGSYEVHVGHDQYYFHRGTFYSHGPRGYTVVRAPIGAHIRDLPSFAVRVFIGDVLYYRYGDVFYRSGPGGYIVVNSPYVSTTVVSSAPPAPAVTVVKASEDYQQVWLGQKEFLFHDGQFFVRTAEGMVWVDAPIGAVTRTLPSDSKTIWYQDIEYFECDEVYFRKTPDGFRVVDAPWKK
jgi:hypothetical protein